MTNFARWLIAWSLALLLVSCGPRRATVIGPASDAPGTARVLESDTRLSEAIRFDFDWELNEAGSRLGGRGVARVEPPYRARLDLFLDGGESVLSAALVEQELRLPYGARHDILPPAGLMWVALGVFHPDPRTQLLAGDELEGGARRLRYRQPNGTEIHYETMDGSLRAVELLEDDHVLQWVRLTETDDSRWPLEATYRNLQDYRELGITRTDLREVESFDPAIWDPR